MVLLTPDTINKSNFNPLSDQNEISLNTIDKVAQSRSRMISPLFALLSAPATQDVDKAMIIGK